MADVMETLRGPDFYRPAHEIDSAGRAVVVSCTGEYSYRRSGPSTARPDR
jgi:hypothetical protein